MAIPLLMEATMCSNEHQVLTSMHDRDDPHALRGCWNYILEATVAFATTRREAVATAQLCSGT